MTTLEPAPTPQSRSEENRGMRHAPLRLMFATVLGTTLVLLGAAGAQTGEKADKTPDEPVPASDPLPEGSDEQFGTPQAHDIAQSARLAKGLNASSDPDPDPPADLSPSEQMKTMTTEVLELQQELAGLDEGSERAAELKDEIAEKLEIMGNMAFDAACVTGTALLEAGKGMRDTDEDMARLFDTLMSLENSDDFLEKLASGATTYPGVDSDMMELFGNVPNVTVFVKNTRTVQAAFLAIEQIPSFSPPYVCQAPPED